MAQPSGSLVWLNVVSRIAYFCNSIFYKIASSGQLSDYAQSIFDGLPQLVKRINVIAAVTGKSRSSYVTDILSAGIKEDYIEIVKKL